MQKRQKYAWASVFAHNRKPKKGIIDKKIIDEPFTLFLLSYAFSQLVLKSSPN